MPAAVGVDPTFGKTCNLARAHFPLKPGQGKAEPFGDDRRVDLHDAVLELDRFHVMHLVETCHACAGLRLAGAG